MLSHSTNQQDKGLSTELPCKCISPTTSTRAVFFSPDVFVKRTIHIKHYSDEEFQATWYNHADYQRMFKEIDLTVEKMERFSGSIDDDKYCTRGLESRTTKGAIKRRKIKNDAIDAVLDEQDLQWNKGVNNSEKLSHVYQAISYRSSCAAHFAGLLDATMSQGPIARTRRGRYTKFDKPTLSQSPRQHRV